MSVSKSASLRASQSTVARSTRDKSNERGVDELTGDTLIDTGAGDDSEDKDEEEALVDVDVDSDGLGDAYKIRERAIRSTVTDSRARLLLGGENGDVGDRSSA